MKIIVYFEDLKLRSWNIDDALDLSIAGSNPDVESNMNDGFPNPYTIEKAMQFIEASHESDNLLLAIEIQGKVIGSIGAFFDKYDRTTAKIAYFIGREYWNKGIGTNAIKAITSYLVEEKGIVKIIAEPFERNIGSRKALEKAGFTLKEIVINGNAKAGIVINSCRYEYIKIV